MLYYFIIVFLEFFVILGVCNTDNFSLLSITIDYGPFGFMEAYNPGIYDLCIYIYINMPYFTKNHHRFRYS